MYESIKIVKSMKNVNMGKYDKQVIPIGSETLGNDHWFFTTINTAKRLENAYA